MQFNSYVFAVFLAIVVAVYNLPWLTWRGQRVWLLLASYAFYAAWDPIFIGILWFATFVDWAASRMIYAAESRRRKKLLVLVSILINLGLLGYFKYGGFVVKNFTALASVVGVDFQPAEFNIILPIGISFYIFHTLSYTLDVYLGRTTPWPRFLDFALYVTFFPALVAGPILRASQFLPQCERQRRTTGSQLAWGLALLVVGLFEKNVIADVVMAPAADDVFNATGQLGALDAWTGTLAFAGQIFCDFAGYSTCAIGIALCLGFSLPDNFRFPYAAIGFSDFWRRWHISLSSWLRDYLYIPLGGNRIGPVRTYVNLSLTMLIGGLWHGASWTFVAWGGLHGLYLIGERVAELVLPAGPWRHTLAARVLGALLTFVLVCIAWVFFRATSFSSAAHILESMFGAGSGSRLLEPGNYPLVLSAIAVVLATHWAMRTSSIETLARRTPWMVRSLALAIMIVSIILMQGQDRAFIYFQF